MKTKIYVFDELDCEILEILRLDTYEYYIRYAEMNEFHYAFGVLEKMKKSDLRKLIKADFGFIDSLNNIWEEI